MSVFSINQVRHLYVAKTLKEGTNLLPTDEAGSILPKADTAKTMLWFQYMSPAGVVSSDKINIANILHAKATASGDMAHKLARYSVSFNEDLFAPGQEYILKIAFRQYIGLSEEDQYFKYGMVKMTYDMGPSEFFAKLAISLAKNVSNETTPLVNIYLAEAGTPTRSAPPAATTLVTADTKESDLTGNYMQLIIEEAEQPWVLGMMPQAFIPFTVQPSTIIYNGDEVIWGTVKKLDPTKTVENGHNIADLEYFCMGARGDLYRGMGYPNVIPTTYLVDPTKKYDTLDIHYAYIGSNESVQKSEKDITLVCEDDGNHTAIKALITAINTATGLQIADPA